MRETMMRSSKKCIYKEIILKVVSVLICISLPFSSLGIPLSQLFAATHDKHTISATSSLSDPGFRDLIERIAQQGISSQELSTLSQQVAKSLTDEEKQNMTQAVFTQMKTVLEEIGVEITHKEMIGASSFFQSLIEDINEEKYPTHKQYLEALFSIWKEVVGDGNIASGTWGREHEEELHTEFRDLINDSVGDVSLQYQNQIKDYIDNLKMIIPSLSIKEPGLEQKLLHLLDNPQLRLFFLKPYYGKDTFSLVSKDADGKDILLEAQSHFGHNKTTGLGREENIYIAAPAFEGKPMGEKLGLLIHELVHLILGRGDEVHQLALELECETQISYDTHYNNQLLKQLPHDVSDYIRIKNELAVAVKKSQQEVSERLYNELVETINTIGTYIHVLSRESMSAEVSRELSLGKKTLLFIEELMTFSVTELTPRMKEVITKTASELVEQLFPENERETWHEKIVQQMYSTHISNFIKADFFTSSLFKEKRDIILDFLIHSATYALATGAVVDTGIILKQTTDMLELKMSIIHECIHYLAKENIITIDDSWEFTTFAGETASIIIDIVKSGTVLENIEKAVMPYLSKFVETAEEALILYEKGKELGTNGASIFQLKPFISDGKAGYVSIDKLVETAISVYEERGLSCDELRLYLTYAKRPPQNIFEQRQAQSVRYHAQRVVGVLLAGVFIGQWERTKKHPLFTMKEYFNKLGSIFSTANKEDKQWIDSVLIPKLQRFVGGIFGRNVLFTASESVDELGLWKYKTEGPLDSYVEYWPLTMIPGSKDDPDRQPYRKEAEERSLGQLLLAEYRAVHRPGPEFERKHAKALEDPIVKGLWEFMLIPKSVYKGHTGALAGIGRMGDKKRAAYHGVPEALKKLFLSLFEFGDAEVEQDLYQSYPLHLQYINSLLKIWCNYDGKEDETFEDLRVIPGSEVEAALVKTYEKGWKNIFFDIRGLDYEDLFKIVLEEIYPTYKELFDLAQQLEEEQKEKEGERITDQLIKQLTGQPPQPQQQGGQSQQQLQSQGGQETESTDGTETVDGETTEGTDDGDGTETVDGQT
ncbi:hypothetical protein ACFL1T_05005, partial [Chlamydiota bacterium]